MQPDCDDTMVAGAAAEFGCTGGRLLRGASGAAQEPALAEQHQDRSDDCPDDATEVEHVGATKPATRPRMRAPIMGAFSPRVRLCVSPALTVCSRPRIVARIGQDDPTDEGAGPRNGCARVRPLVHPLAIEWADRDSCTGAQAPLSAVRVPPGGGGGTRHECRQVKGGRFLYCGPGNMRAVRVPGGIHLGPASLMPRGADSCTAAPPSASCPRGRGWVPSRSRELDAPGARGSCTAARSMMGAVREAGDRTR